MTDERPPNVLAFERPKRAAPPMPPCAADFACMAYVQEGSDNSRPLALTLEFRGKPIGVLGTYANTDEGMADAREAARLAVRVLDLLANTAPPAGGDAA